MPSFSTFHHKLTSEQLEDRIRKLTGRVAQG